MSDLESGRNRSEARQWIIGVLVVVVVLVVFLLRNQA